MRLHRGIFDNKEIGQDWDKTPLLHLIVEFLEGIAPGNDQILYGHNPKPIVDL